MKTVSRNEYFDLIGKLGVKQTENEYKIAPLDLSKYHLNEITQRIADNNFMEESTDRNGNYMLRGHWLSDLCYIVETSKTNYREMFSKLWARVIYSVFVDMGIGK